MSDKKRTTKKAKATRKESVSYSGELKVSLRKSGKTLTSKTYHNAGTRKLFRFICDSLAGNFTTSYRPSGIALFGLAGDEPADNEEEWTFNKDVALTPILAADTTAIAAAESGDDPTAGCAVTYSFSIPTSYIATSGTQSRSIYKAALYGAYAKGVLPEGGRADALAYLGFVENGAWEPIYIESSGENYSLLLEWKLKVGNSTAEE